MSRSTQRPFVRSLAAAWERLRVTNGNLYAGAITFFSFLAIFPLLLLGVSVLGFVLHAHPDTLQRLLDKIATNAPGQVGKTLDDSIRTAIDARASLGIIGLAGVLLTGLGWIGNLRAALDAIWMRTPPKENPVKQRLVSLGILAVLGVGVLVSLGLTAGWAAFSHQVLRALGLDGITGMGTLLGALGILVAVVGDAVIFFVVLVRLPRAQVPARVGLRGALLAAAGFELLKIAGTYTVAATAHSATAGPFAGLVAVLIWLQLVTRWMLFSAAWTAELTRSAAPPPAAVPVQVPFQQTATPGPPVRSGALAVGAGLLGAGAIAGALAATVLRRHGRGQRPTA